jgi:tetratricopeptide (TPR) repeat protein/tRNA A-37 threonylcarbamoyl transferase component Bud32
MVCPDEAKISEFVSRALPAASAAEVEAHLADCDDCRHLVFALASGGEDPGPAEASVERVGRFEVIEAIGRGAMGVVYRARDPELDRVVAIKVRRSSARLDVEGEDRLRREAQALAKLAHPNVVTVYETGHHEKAAYVAMEHVDGVTLDSWLATPRLQATVISVLADAGRGLAAAHAVGLVHRDFKPRNVFVSTAGVAKVGDFGLVRLDALEATPSPASDLAMTLSVAGAILGTPAYMAPEQLRGEPATEASDQFSFCVTLYEALYGKRPFTGTSIEQLLAAMARDVALPATAPKRVRRVLERGLAADPQRRYRSMSALLEDLAKRSHARRWVVAGLIGAGAVTLAAVAFGGSAAPIESSPCSGDSARIRETWNPARRAKLEAALVAGHLYPSGTVTSILEDVDRYTDRWNVAQTTACRATQRGEQSTELFDRQVGCLDDRAVALGSRIEVLTHDNQSIAHALELTSGLPRISDCEALSDLLRLPPPPGDPATRRALADARAALARASALQDAGRSGEALEVLRPLPDLGYAPIDSQIALLRGISQSDLGHPREADQLLGTAVAHGLTAGRDDVLAKALIYRATVRQLRFADRERSDEYLAQALALLARRPSTSADVYHLASQVYLARKDYANATTSIERALAHLDHSDGPRDRINRAVTTEVLGGIQIDQGHLEAGYEILRGVYDVVGHELGESHPTVARVAAELGVVCERLGRTADATRYFTASARSFTGSSSIDHQGVAAVMYMLRPAADRTPAQVRDNALVLVALSNVQTNVDDSIAILSIASAFLFEAGDLGASRHASERAVTLAGNRTVDQLQVALVSLAFVELTNGELASARGHVERGIAIERKTASPDPVLLGAALHLLGIERYRSASFPAALQNFNEAARLAAADATEDTEELRKVLPFWIAATRYRTRSGGIRADIVAMHSRLAADPDVSVIEKTLMESTVRDLPP